MSQRKSSASDYRSVVESTGDAAFATDEECRIVAWNAAAERALGHRAADVIGRRCHEVLEGIDRHGNPFCRPDCNIQWAVRRQDAVLPFEVEVRAADGRRLVQVSTLILPGTLPSDRILIHLLRFPEEHVPVDVEGLLTRRERQVLRLLAGGAVVKDIATSLGLGEATVRTHVSNLLRKLGAHTQVEAVVTAFRCRLI